MTKLDAILDVQPRQLTIDGLLAEIEAEERDHAPLSTVAADEIGDVSPQKIGLSPHKPCKTCGHRHCPYSWAKGSRARICPALREYYNNNGGES